MYCTADQVRRRLGLNETELTDDELDEYIKDAQSDVLKDIAIFCRDDGLVGELSGKTFTTTYPFIADSNFDLVVTPSDVQVFGWTDSDDPVTRTSIAVSTVYSAYGKLVLSAVPSTYEKVTANYYYYPREIDVTKLDVPCSWLAAYYYALNEYVLIPEQWMHGAYRFRIVKPYLPLYEKYLESIERLRGSASEVSEHDDISLLRSG